MVYIKVAFPEDPLDRVINVIIDKVKHKDEIIGGGLMTYGHHRDTLVRVPFRYYLHRTLIAKSFLIIEGIGQDFHIVSHPLQLFRKVKHISFGSGIEGREELMNAKEYSHLNALTQKTVLVRSGYSQIVSCRIREKLI